MRPRCPPTSRVALRSALGDDVAVVHLYFRGEPPSLRQHFASLETFDPGDGAGEEAPTAADMTQS
jgi:hypothetical protein